jgi:hypothetical protein
MGFFEVSRSASRRARIRAKLPTEHPASLDEISSLVAALPDPEVLCAEQRAGTMAVVATLTNQLQAYLARVAAVSDKQGDSRVLGCRYHGDVGCGCDWINCAGGSAIVHTARELESFPELSEAFAAGRVSGQHVSVILATTEGLKRRALR